MAGQPDSNQGPDLAIGVAVSEIPPSGLLKGHVGDDAVLLARSGDEFFAIGASCTHYHGPLEQGVCDGDTVRCPWHHACFSLRTGEAVRAPAFDPVGCWHVEQRDALSGDAPQPAPTVVVSNPPYIGKDEMEKMKANVVNHEPHGALFVPGNDVLLFYKTII
jgi:nitrite reductase/ring-hydroxylating ferredoxin subunit